MKIKILKANSGDSILITFKGDDKRNHNILIDGGWKRTYNTILKREIREIVIKKEFIDLVVITHIDKDHILGITRFIQDILASKDHSNPLFAYDPVLNYWFNSLQSIKLYINDPTNKTGYQEGNDLETLLEEMGKWDSNQSIVDTMETYNIGRVTITVISPRFAELETLGEKWEDYNESLKTGRRTNDYDNTIEELFQQSQAELKRQGELEEDTSGNNASSIAFLFEYRGNKFSSQQRLTLSFQFLTELCNSL
jgi:hypothetical protein